MKVNALLLVVASLIVSACGGVGLDNDCNTEKNDIRTKYGNPTFVKERNQDNKHIDEWNYERKGLVFEFIEENGELCKVEHFVVVTITFTVTKS